MALTDEDKVNITLAIKGIFGNLIYVEPYQITEDVEVIVNNLVKEIANCTKNVSSLMEAYEMFYTGLPIKSIAKMLKLTMDRVISDWVAASRKEFSKRACVDTTISKWRSVLQLEIMGL